MEDIIIFVCGLIAGGIAMKQWKRPKPRKDQQMVLQGYKAEKERQSTLEGYKAQKS